MLLDYDAPLSEAGDYTEKYDLLVELIGPALAVETKLPPRPEESIKTAFSEMKTADYLTLNDLINQVVLYTKRL